MAFTLSVRSFQVPVTPRTLAWPPSLPSVPTSRATRVTSDTNEPSCSNIVLTTLPMRKNSPRNARPSISRFIVCDRSPLATAPITRAIFPGRLHHVADQVIDHVDVSGPQAGRVRQLGPVPDLALLTDNVAEAFDFLAHALIELDH